MNAPPASAPIVVVTSADDEFAVPLAAMVRSLVEHLPASQPLTLHVIAGSLSTANRARLMRSWPFPHLHVRWLEPPAGRAAALPVWGRMTIHTYYRLFLDDILDASDARVLWLDADLIVRRDLSPLWHVALGAHGTAAVQDPEVPYVSSRYGVAGFAELGLPARQPYFNAGVMLIDRGWWRRHDITRLTLAYVNRYRRQLTFCDQEGLNAALGGRWTALDARWNEIASVVMRRTFAPPHLDVEAIERLRSDPWIVHYAGWWKPWRLHAGHPRRRLFFDYLDRTSWAGWRPRPSVGHYAAAMYSGYVRDVLYPCERWGMTIWRAAARS
jgi:lipopolysaccharide biosynthesis glycosyltransferase